MSGAEDDSDGGVQSYGATVTRRVDSGGMVTFLEWEPRASLLELPFTPRCKKIGAPNLANG